MPTSGDFVCIRGRELKLSELFDSRLLDSEFRKELRENLQTGVPFPVAVHCARSDDDMIWGNRVDIWDGTDSL